MKLPSLYFKEIITAIFPTVKTLVVALPLSIILGLFTCRVCRPDESARKTDFLKQTFTSYKKEDSDPLKSAEKNGKIAGVAASIFSFIAITVICKTITRR